MTNYEKHKEQIEEMWDHPEWFDCENVAHLTGAGCMFDCRKCMLHAMLWASSEPSDTKRSPMYCVIYGNGNRLISNSRDAKRHLRELGGDCVTVTTLAGRLVSMAKIGSDGKPHSCHIQGEKKCTR